MAAHPKASALALLAAAAALSVWPLSTRAALLAWATSLLLSTRRPARRNTGFFSQPTGPSHPASGASVTPPEHALWFNAVLAALWPVCLNRIKKVKNFCNYEISILSLLNYGSIFSSFVCL